MMSDAMIRAAAWRRAAEYAAAAQVQFSNAAWAEFRAMDRAVAALQNPDEAVLVTASRHMADRAQRSAEGWERAAEFRAAAERARKAAAEADSEEAGDEDATDADLSKEVPHGS